MIQTQTERLTYPLAAYHMVARAIFFFFMPYCTSGGQFRSIKLSGLSVFPTSLLQSYIPLHIDPAHILFSIALQNVIQHMVIAKQFPK